MAIKNLFQHFPTIKSTDYKEMLAETGLDLVVHKRNLYYADSLGVTRENPEKVAIARISDGAFLGTVGKDFGLNQYAQTYEFAEALTFQEGAEYVSGGIIGKGERAFLSFKTGEKITLPGGDEIENYFYIATGHDGQQAIDVIPAPLRTINNTVLRMPESRGCGFRIRHTKYVDNHIAKARQSINKVKNYWATYQKSFDYLSKTRLTDGQLNDYLKMVVEGKEESSRAENIREEIRNIYLKDRMIVAFPATHNTLLGAYFSVVQYCDSENIVVRKSKNDRKDATTCRIISMIDGNAAQRKADGFAFALQMLHKMSGVRITI